MKYPRLLIISSIGGLALVLIGITGIDSVFRNTCQSIEKPFVQEPIFQLPLLEVFK